MLDDANVVKQRDPRDALGVAATEWEQLRIAMSVRNGEHDGREIRNIVIAAMGGGALAAETAATVLGERLKVPLTVVRDYEVPAYVDEKTLVICVSYSGNTEETLAAFDEAKFREAQMGVIAAGGQLIERAVENGVAHIHVQSGLEPRMGVLFNLRAVMTMLVHFGMVREEVLDSLAEEAEWLRHCIQEWLPEVGTDRNYAKQLALLSVGKSAVFYGGRITAVAAAKWKIAWNENAKNLAFWNTYPEVSHNEFTGWSSHPVDKPYAVFDLRSPLEYPRVQLRFELTDKLLSGVRPKAVPIELQGVTLLQQLLWSAVLSDFVSIYLAVLNGVDPTPVPLVDKLKNELSK